MNPNTLVCTALSPDGIVAHFSIRGSDREVFAYLPHIPGLNPWLLRIGDEVEGIVEQQGERSELVRGITQSTRFDQDRRHETLPTERICLPFPRS